MIRYEDRSYNTKHINYKARVTYHPSALLTLFAVK